MASFMNATTTALTKSHDDSDGMTNIKGKIQNIEKDLNVDVELSALNSSWDKNRP